MLQSFGEFTVPSLISVVSNGVMIAYLIIFGNRLGLEGVAVSMLIAWALQLFVQIPYLIKFGCRYRFRLDFKDSGIKEAALIALPVLISSWVQPLCNVINMSFGSSLGDGAVSALNWANKIYIIMVGVFAYAITNFIFPKLSRLASSENGDEFAEMTRMSVGYIAAIIGIVCALFLALSRPIISVVFERGEFTAENTAITGTALFFYSFGMVGYAICEVLNKSFYALSDGRTPMMTSLIGIVVNFGMAALLVGGLKMGVGGSRSASAVSSLTIAACLLFYDKQAQKGRYHRGFYRKPYKNSDLYCGGFCCRKGGRYICIGNRKRNDNDAGQTLYMCGPAVLVYVGFAYIIGVNEIRTAAAKLRGIASK